MSIEQLVASEPLAPAWGWPHRFGGRAPNVTAAPEYQATTTQLCGLFPFVAGSGSPTVGTPIGRHLLHGEVVCLDPTTGKTAWEGAFPKGRSNFYASPLVAGDRLYAAREDGTVFVASLPGAGEGAGAGDKLKVLAENDMGESIIGSPVPAGNRLLIRGANHLFCLGGE